MFLATSGLTGTQDWLLVIIRALFLDLNKIQKTLLNNILIGKKTSE